MRNMTTQVLSMEERNYQVLDNLSVGTRINENPYSIPTESFFSLAARNNPKRSYLFVSKLIGKNIPVHPHVPFLTGFLLASRLAETLGLAVSRGIINEAVNLLSLDHDGNFQRPLYQFPGKALFIGFAETATALGHSVFDCFMGDIIYLHTTREDLQGSADTIYFTEDHCHAPEQRCLVCDTYCFKDNDMLILIDDEITSGNTCLNFIKNIQEKYGQKQYMILTILDWRSDLAKEKYAFIEQELGVSINVISLCSGNFQYNGTSPYINEQLFLKEGITLTGRASSKKVTFPNVETYYEPIGLELEIDLSSGRKLRYLKYTGRFGMDVRDSNILLSEATRLGQKLSMLRKGKKTLCLGTGEFMYTPFLIAGNMGEGVLVQSTTRSPAHPHLRKDYAVQYALSFIDPFRPNIKYFVYNIQPSCYDEVFIFWEREVIPESVDPLVHSLNKLGIENIVFVSHCR